MSSGEESARVRSLRPATPPDGPLGSSDAAPDPAPPPHSRRLVPDEARPASADPALPAEATTVEPATADATKLDGPKAGGPEADAAEARTAGDDAAAEDEAARSTARRRRRMPFAHAVRLPPPRQAVTGAARVTRAWARRPSGRLTLSGVFLFALVATTGAVGAVVVPAVWSTKPVAVDATDPGAAVLPAPGALPDATAAAVVPGPPVSPGLAATALPGGVATSGPATVPGTARPADTIADWARVTGAKVGVSPVAMQAYGYAELVLAETNRGCQLSWTTLAAIGYVESRHGQANGATLKSTGRAEPEIIGDPLDGNGGRSLIRDTDRGLFDRDTTYDRAIGPMQFIPTTWQEIGADADNDGRKDPHDLDDAALAAGRYLCKGGRNMTVPGDWWGAILSYNDVRRYATDVFDKANEYGRASRT
ncbi:murein transglycosylase [Micromonospora sp. KC606]|uniref:lytic transglycosylase domain-containing protein n=1 Tax=Micromonospora sp. KC606 TaxID=2530379 RepID=UPI00104D4F4D|nr:lytic murein transglycosylase [Micromonospora sp. KC606]TDC82145.1 murein transglycosylase [Micromonospora sp. KC606]